MEEHGRSEHHIAWPTASGVCFGRTERECRECRGLSFREREKAGLISRVGENGNEGWEWKVGSFVDRKLSKEIYKMKAR